METKFNQSLQKKKRFSLRPDWQERLPVKPVVAAIFAVLLLTVLVLVNQPTQSVLNSAEMDMVREKGLLRIGVDTDIPGLYRQGEGLEADIGNALGALIFEDTDRVVFVETDRYTAVWQMADGYIDLALVSMPSFSGSAYGRSEEPFFVDECVLLGYETGPLAGKTVAVLQETPCQTLLYQYLEEHEPEMVVRPAADYYSMLVMLRAGAVDAVCVPETVVPTLWEAGMKRYEGNIGTIPYHAISEQGHVLSDLCSELFWDWQADGTFENWYRENGLE